MKMNKSDYNWDYQALKRLHICVSCKKRPAEVGRVRCEYCAEKGRIRYLEKRKDPALVEKMRSQGRKTRAARIAAGKCEACGNPIYKNSKSYCYECTIRNRRRAKEKREAQAYTRTIECEQAMRERRLKVLEKARQARKTNNSGHIWREHAKILFKKYKAINA